LKLININRFEKKDVPNTRLTFPILETFPCIACITAEAGAHVSHWCSHHLWFCFVAATLPYLACAHSADPSAAIVVLPTLLPSGCTCFHY
jgi:hypothetical protein